MKAQPNRALALMLAEVLEVPLPKATNILKAIFQAIKHSLLRGEKAYIEGFGGWKVVTRTRRPTPNNILTNDHRGKPVAYATDLRYYKPKRVVVFKPSMPLMAMLNMDSPTYKERRSQRRWTS